MNSFPIKSVLTLIVIALIGFPVLFGSWYTVDQGERGVVLRNGAVISVSEPGLGFKLPIIDSVKKLSVQSRKVEFTGMSTYSRDQQPAFISASVNYRLNPE